MNFPRAHDADIALLLEGTFPYVAGGVSSWVHQIIRGFPEYRFAVVFIGSKPDDYGEMKYTLPNNVVHLETHYLSDNPVTPHAGKVRDKAGIMGDVRRLHESFDLPEAPQQRAELFGKLLPALIGKHTAPEMFLHSRGAWSFIRDSYEKRCTDPSFIDYFWTVRSMHTPVWLLARIAETFIPVRAYHTISTGYAGLLGVMLKAKTGRPLILSEHGIYTKERKIDLFHAQWIRDNRNVFERDPADISYFRQLWIRFFQVLGKQCYDSADQIVALYEANRLRQIEDGAPEQRTRNVPNGVDVARFAALREQRPAAGRPVLCLIGRVVPIKDIKTYIRAMCTVAARLPGAEAWIAGPEDEAPEYAQECRQLAQSLGLGESVKFMGFQQVTELMPRIRLVALTSISEGLPLVVLEGFAAGVPAVTTDVGCCRQLIYGLEEADKAFGAAGRVVRIADPQAFAEAALELLADDAAWHAASEAGIKRVETYYTQEQMFASYRGIYERATEWRA